MIHEGKAVTVKALDNGIVELNFDLQGESVNKFNKETMDDLREAVNKLKSTDSIKGMIVTSGKGVFIVGADITEFTSMFQLSEEELIKWSLEANEIFSGVEDLPFPTVSAINGLALGGGLEMCLATDYRVMSSTAQVGLPEVKLGLFPGFGGTVRMPRLIGVDNAVEWISAGTQNLADKALKDGVVDAVVAPDKLRESALKLVQDCIDGTFDYKAKRQEKLDPIKLPPMENLMAFQSCMGMVMQKAGRNYPAPLAAVEAMQHNAQLHRKEALLIEASGFAKLAKTPVAAALIGLFLNDQALKKTAAAWQKKANPVKRAAVLGAGIMGGGIALQSASKGIPIFMKDIAEPALELGMAEATKILAKKVIRKKMKPEKMGAILSEIRPTLSYDGFEDVDMVVEAVVENPNVKKAVLAETEKHIGKDAIMASNTSTISINRLAEDLKRPENFVGMHFFNPVNMMPLVEVIRGEKSSDEAIATTVAYASKIGKSPVVVNDCPGFFVNRVLFPYFGGFNMLVRDGADFPKVDKVMEKFGWPMGPAYLLDVIGLDTGVHAAKVMEDGFPDRMSYDFKDALTVLFENERYGQKNDVGFYKYELDRKGKTKKVNDPVTYELIKPFVASTKDFEDQEIIDRLMIPMCLESVRCLEENIVDSAADADMALIMGVGFPPFRGGALRYIDTIGVKAFVETCDKYKDLGPLYTPTERLREMAKTGESFYG